VRFKEESRGVERSYEERNRKYEKLSETLKEWQDSTRESEVCGNRNLEKLK